MKRVHTTLSINSWVVVLLSLAAITSCSQSRELQRLKKEHNSYTHSKFVIENMSAHPVSRSETAQENAVKHSQNEKELKLIKQKLKNQQKYSNAHINNTVQQNGLFTATRAWQQQVALLKSKRSLESWLTTHFSLSAVLTVALQNNLDIQSRLEQVKASLAKYDQVSFLDDTLAQYAAFTKDLSIPVGKKKHNKAVVDGFPFPGLLGLKASIIDQSVESSRLQLKQTVQDTITETRIAYYELQLAKEEIAVISREIGLLRSLKNQLSESYATSTTELGNILDVDIEIEKNRNKRQVARDQLLAKQARLNALLNLSPEFAFKKIQKLRPVKLTTQDKALVTIGQQNRVEVARLQSELKKMERIIQLSEKRFYPDFSAGYSRFQNQPATQSGSNASKEAFSTRPRFKKRNFFGMNDAYLTETKLKYKALQSKLRALQNQTADDIQQALSNYQSQKRSHVLYQSRVIPKSKTTLEISKNLFETGDASYFRVIDIQQDILNYKLQLLKATKGMNVNAAKLSRFVGKTLTQ